MAEKKNNLQPPKMQNTTQIDTDVFVKGMIKDPNASITNKENWTHARNAINNSDRGDTGTIGNEPANLYCATITYPIIGTIHLYGDKWAVFSTDDTTSEIGIFDDSECTYSALVNDGGGFTCPPVNCLNFKRQYLITGAAKENFDCTWQLYWDDGLNPSRTMNISDIPYIEQIVSEPGADCIVRAPIEPKQLDCERLRLAPYLDTPTIVLSKSDNGGQLRNGSYQAYIAYTINGQQIGDWIGISNVQSLFAHEDLGGSLDIKLSNIDKGEFDEFKLCILSNNQMEPGAKQMGFYSTETTHINIDFIDPSLKTVPVEYLPLRNPAYEKSERMYVVNDYLIRQGPTEKFDFNYQPLANEITTNYVVTQFPADYYKSGGNKPTFMRDEVYSFFIRWIYATGERSSSYHIPGTDIHEYNTPWTGDDGEDLKVNEELPSGDANAVTSDEKIFNAYNTAGWADHWEIGPYFTNDGGVILYRGKMAYWESTEKYPMDTERWGDLCGKPIRHHKFPDEQTQSYYLDRAADNNQTINVLGVKFENIALPRLNPPKGGPCENPSGEAALVPGIVGYEILVGSRAGNKSIIAKGLARNMRGYRLPPDASGNAASESAASQLPAPGGGTAGVMANYPFNDLGCDPFLHDPGNTTEPRWAYDKDGNANPYSSSWTRPDMYTFHSPDTSFNRPFLSPFEVKSYGVTHGMSYGRFKVSEKHPQQKLLKDSAAIISIIIGAGYAIGRMRGKKQVAFDYSRPQANFNVPFVNPALNAAGAGVMIGVGAGTETIHTLGTVAGAPTLSENVARIGNTAGTIPAESFMVAGAGPSGTTVSYDRQDSWFAELPGLLQPFFGIFAFMQSTAEGGNHIIELIYNLCSFQDYAYKYNAHGLYWMTEPYSNGERFRSKVWKARYVQNTMQMLSATVKMNNLFRPNTVALISWNGQNLKLPGGDNSRRTIQNRYRPSMPFSTNISAHYVGLKVNFENQYGQIDSIKQIPIRNGEWGGGVQYLNPDEEYDRYTRLQSGALYGGDCYINRYTEKTVMPLYWDFLLGQPEGFPYDYRLRANVMYPMFWANFHRYDLSALTRYITSFEWLKSGGGQNQRERMPNGMHHLDRGQVNCGGSVATGMNIGGYNSNQADPFDSAPSADNDKKGKGKKKLKKWLTGSFSQPEGGGAPTAVSDDSPDNRGKGLFHIKDRYFYTHINGVQDFWCESEINTALRDWEDTEPKRHYDWLEYTDVNGLFHADHILSGNFYKYDQSLSVSQFLSHKISSGNIQPRWYDPQSAETCWTHYPKRLVYSLQAQLEATKDFWRVFLPNNYKDFKNKVNVIKPISKSGAVILFPHLSPVLWQGVDTLQTDLGTKVTIGDGGLFSQPQQNIVNADLAHEYGSCESQRSVINTPHGLFYISQAQGKIFQMPGQGLQAISDMGMKQWFNQYLPSKLVEQFPQAENCLNWSDNPVAGVGCQSVYDPNYDLVYFMKKDYHCISECIDFKPCEGFVYNQTRCDGIDPVICCPEDSVYNPDTGMCSGTTFEPAIENVHSPNCEYDIVLSMDASSSIQANLNTNEMKDLIKGLAEGFADQLATGAVRIAVVAWHDGGDIGDMDVLDFTDNLNTIIDWADNQYDPEHGTNPTAGFWQSLEKLYAEGRPYIPKILVQAQDGYDSVCINLSGQSYAGFDSPASSATPTTPEMRKCISLNPNEPGDISYYQAVQNPGPICSAVAQGYQDNFLSWLQSNVFNNPKYNDPNNDDFRGSLTVWGLWLTPSNDHPDPNFLPTQSNIDYTIARSTSIANAAWGTFTTATIQGMVQQFLDTTCPETSTWICPSGCALIEGPAAPYCQCPGYEGPPEIVDSVYPVPLSDTRYFTDISWTVSYDPKSKAWISFHDWHPELTLPSLKHFLTTKSRMTNDPICPPGYDWNPETQLCEQWVEGEFPATITVHENNANVDQQISTEELSCPFDIVISVDASSSTTNTGEGSGTIWFAQLAFIDAFIAELEPDMTSGGVQIAINQWASSVSHGSIRNRALTNDAAALRTWMGAGPVGSAYYGSAEDNGYNFENDAGTGFFLGNQGGGTSYKSAMAAAKHGLDDEPFSNPTAGTNSDGLSYLGNRFDDVNLKRYAIIITDTQVSKNYQLNNNTITSDGLDGAGDTVNAYIWNTGTSGLWRAAYDLGWHTSKNGIEAFGSDYDSGQTQLGPEYEGSRPWMDIKTVAVFASSQEEGSDYINKMFTLCESFYQAGLYEKDDDDDDITASVSEGASPRDSYMVWPANFSQPAEAIAQGLECTYTQDLPDICNCDDLPGYTLVYKDGDGNYTLANGTCEQGVICRKVDCYCDTSQVPGMNITPTGNCPDIFEIGDPGYENPIPRMCTYATTCGIPPGLERGTLWKHNVRCDLFANYYDLNYPWEIEWVESLGQTVNTLRSIEYQQESYIYKGALNNNCGDRFHDLDFNFDEAIIYNTEQVSGLLKLNLTPKNNVPLLTQYPIIGGNEINILYSKEEQKYRFNQFWDVTQNRGEFDPTISNSIFLTQLNGYIRDLNTQNLNYNKPALQRKKFRHYYNKVILRREFSGNRKMILKLANTKMNYSYR